MHFTKNECHTDKVKLGSIRELAALKIVLKDSTSSGPDPVYWVFGEISEEKWANLTVITPGNYNGEFPKTFGHYHPENAPDETYQLIDGQGVLIMQKKDLSEVYLIKAKPGDEIIITPEYGHSWSNLGKKPLISYDDWRSGHQPSDYADIARLHGMAYYLIEEGGEVKAVPNPNYKDLPEPIWVTSKEFSERGDDV